MHSSPGATRVHAIRTQPEGRTIKHECKAEWLTKGQSTPTPFAARCLHTGLGGYTGGTAAAWARMDDRTSGPRRHPPCPTSQPERSRATAYDAGIDRFGRGARAGGLRAVARSGRELSEADLACTAAPRRGRGHDGAGGPRRERGGDRDGNHAVTDVWAAVRFVPRRAFVATLT